MASFGYLHLYADDNGESHFDARELATSTQDFTPPAAPLAVSSFQAASGFVPIQLPVGWGETRSIQRIGADLAAGERPQGIVPAGAWQSARSLGAWTLVGCTVAPGFEFGRFDVVDGEPPQDWRDGRPPR